MKFTCFVHIDFRNLDPPIDATGFPSSFQHLLHRRLSVEHHSLYLLCCASSRSTIFSVDSGFHLDAVFDLIPDAFPDIFLHTFLDALLQLALRRASRRRSQETLSLLPCFARIALQHQKITQKLSRIISDITHLNHRKQRSSRCSTARTSSPRRRACAWAARATCCRT